MYQDNSYIKTLTEGLSIRVRNALQRAGYKTLNDLDGLTQKEVTQIMELGSVSLDEIDWVMEVYGFTFKEGKFKEDEV